MKKVHPAPSITRTLPVLVAVLSFALLAVFYVSRSSAQDGPKVTPAKTRSENLYGPFDYAAFLEREKNGEFPFQGGPVQQNSPYNSLTNNNGGATGTCCFTQSETTLTAFGNTVVVGFNDAGSNAGGTNKFTGFARSTDGGATFTDGGSLPTNPNGDAGDPVLARNEVTGRIYFATLQFDNSGMNVFHSDNNGATWSLPVQGMPGKTGFQDKEWIAVDNFAGPGNGNVYLAARDFGAGNGVYFYRSTDHGATFGPNGGTLLVAGGQGAFVAVGPDHSVYAFWYGAADEIKMRKSSDQGVTFAPAVTVISGMVGGTNGDLALTGTRPGTASASGFRSNSFPHVVVNPVSGHLYATFNNDGPGADKADVFLAQSTDGGATWGVPVKVNDDATTTDQWQPTLAVTPGGDTLGIFYYSRQEDPAGNNLFKFYGRNATIAGATLTFTPSYAISDVASTPEFGRDTVVNTVYMGDYDHAVATGGAFHVVWADNREDLTGGSPRKDPNVYYKKIPLTISVTTTIPAVASVISTLPTVFTVNISEPANAATVQAGDLTVNGIPATSVAYTPGSQTMVFTFAVSPVTVQGAQTMHINAGAFTSAAGGDPVIEFTGVFRYDAVLLQVVSTVPAVGGVFSLPAPLTYDVNFNEPVDPASVQTGDLHLSGIAGSTVTGVSVLPGNTTARFTLSVLSEGVLNASIAAGAITDVFGNIGAAFSGTYSVDIVTVPYPTPLLAKNPAGSLIYDPSVAGNIGFAGDTDSFTLNVDPGQTITAIVTGPGALRASVQLRDPANAVIGTATAAAAGQNALLQTAPAVTGGIYTFIVSGAGGTIGNYTLQVILNAAKEMEGTVVGASNNTIATAQDVNSSFITLQTSLGNAQRGAVNGSSDSANYTAAAVAFGFEDISATGTVIAGLINQDDASVSIPIGFSFPFYGNTQTAVFVSTNGLLTFGGANTTFSNADLTTTPSQAGIAPFWDDLHTGGGAAASNVFSQVTGVGPDQHLTIQWNQVRFLTATAGDTLTFQVQLYADGRIKFNYLDLVAGASSGNNGASASVGVKAAGTQGPDRLLLAFNNGPNAFVGTGLSTLLSPPNPAPDFYSFTMSAGDVTTLAVKSLGMTGANVELLNAGGVVIASGVAGATNVDSVVSNFAVPGAGTYYARVTSMASVPYDLVLTRNAAFDTEGNDTSATAQALGGTKGALGSIAKDTVYQAAAIPFVFDDISGTGTLIAGLTDQDDASVSIPIGFTFPFYGANNTAVFVSCNGLLTFGTLNNGFTNTDLTTAPSQATITPFWDDQHTSDGGVFYEVSGAGSNQHLTIQWNEVEFFVPTPGDTLTYQVQLFADGRIKFNYQDLVAGASAGNNGAAATVGLKNAGTQGPDRLLLAFNNGPNAFVGTGKSTLISQPTSDDWYSLTVGGVQGRLTFETSTPADGPGEFVNNLNPEIELYNSASVLIASGTVLGDGRNESLDKGGLAPGTYLLRVSREGDSNGEYFVSSLARACPTIATTTLPSGTAGSNYSQQIMLTPAGTYTFSLAGGALPNGITLNTSTGVISGTTLLSGVYNFSIQAQEPSGCSVTQAYTLTINCPPVVLSPVNLPSGTAGTPYNQSVSASPALGYTFAVTSGALPPGVTLNVGTGALTGAPTGAGTFNFGITATSTSGCAGSRNYSLLIVCPTITLNPASLPGGGVGVAYSQSVSGSPTLPYSYIVSGGSLPLGLTLHPTTGAITGTPISNGTYNFAISASAGSCTGSRNYTITITCQPISITTMSLPAGTGGVNYSQAVNVSPAGSYNFSLILGTLPSGMTLNASTGVISGLTFVPGTYNFTVKAQAPNGCNETKAYTLLINCPTVTVNPMSLPNGQIGTPYSQQITASPGSYTYSFTGNLPPGLSLHPITGILSGTPTANGTFIFTVKGTDIANCMGTRMYSVTIIAGACPAITLPNLPNGKVGTLFMKYVTPTPAGAYTYSLTGTLPPGLTFFSGTGLVYGYPSVAGGFNFSITATNVNGCSGMKSYPLMIAP